MISGGIFSANTFGALGGGGGSGGASPLTTKGDIYAYSTLDARLPVGANGQVLTADSTQALGLRWATPAGGIAIGAAITGGTANRMLFESSANVLAESSAFRPSATQFFLNSGSASVPILANEEGNPNSGIFFTGTGSSFGVGFTELGTEYFRFSLVSQPILDARAASFARLAHNGNNALNWSSTAVGFEKDLAGGTGLKFGADGSTFTFDSANLTTGGVVIGVVNGAAYSTPNYKLDIRSTTAATAVYSQYSIVTTTGNASTDGLIIGLHTDGTARIRQQENLGMEFYTNNILNVSLAASGALTIGPGAGGVTHRLNTNTTTANADVLTLLNGPTGTAGNPDTYLTININGTDHVIPAWIP